MQYLLVICRIFLVSLMFLSGSLPATTHLTLNGSAVDSNLGLNSQANRAVSASISTDVGTYLRVGLTHRQALSSMEGYGYDETADTYAYKSEITHSTANSLDLTVILYYGKLMVPYLQIGFVKKNYVMKSKTANEPTVTNVYSLPPVPNGGIGVGIRINSDFSLKLSYTVSPGIKQTDPDLEPERVLDSYTSVGISYDI